MTAGALIFAWKQRDRGTEPVKSLHLDSPVSLRHVLNLGALFVVMEIVGTIGARFLGKFGFLALSLLSGMASRGARPQRPRPWRSTASSRPTGLVSRPYLHPSPAHLVNLPLVQRQSRDKRLTRTLAVISLLLVAAELVVLTARERYR